MTTNGKLLTTLGACAPQVANLTLALSGTFTILVHDQVYTHTGNYALSVQSVTGGGCNSTAIVGWRAASKITPSDHCAQGKSQNASSCILKRP